MLTTGILAWLVLGLIVAAATGRLSLLAWCRQLFIAVDQVVNVLATPFHSGAWADETLSARAYRAHKDGRRWGRFWMPVIDVLFWWQAGGSGHCERAYIAERERLQAPPETR